MISGRNLPHVAGSEKFLPSRYNDMVDEVVRLGQMSVAGPAESYTSAGGEGFMPIRLDRIYASITALTGSAYSWTEIFQDAGGGSTNGTRSGTATNDPAYEANGIVVPSAQMPFNTILRRPATSINWVFFTDLCECS
jgi:hypothetical protein